MTQDELNRELDGLLEELIFNGDITAAHSPWDMKRILLETARETLHDVEHNPVVISEEQWQQYALYCLQSTVESALRAKKDRVQ